MEKKKLFFQKEKQEFQKKMAFFREQYPDLLQISKKPDVAKGSVKAKCQRSFKKMCKK